MVKIEVKKNLWLKKMISKEKVKIIRLNVNIIYVYIYTDVLFSLIESIKCLHKKSTNV